MKLRINIQTGGVNLNWLELSPIANGPVANGNHTIQNVGNGQSLNVDGGGIVVTSGNAAQWTLEHLGGAEYKISLAGGDAWTTWMGPVHLGPWWGASGDRSFLIIPADGGNYRIRPSGSGQALEPSTDHAPQLAQEVVANSTSQQWAIH